MNRYEIRKINESECLIFANLLVKVYSNIEGYIDLETEKEYYYLLLNIHDFFIKPGVTIYVAVKENIIIGGIVYFLDLNYYSSRKIISDLKDTSGVRFLVVDKYERRTGIAEALMSTCIKKTSEDENKYLILHSSNVMKHAMCLYEKFGFKRFEELFIFEKKLNILGLILDIRSL